MNWQQLVENENLLGIVRKNIKSNISLLRIFSEEKYANSVCEASGKHDQFSCLSPQTTRNWIWIQVVLRKYFTCLHTQEIFTLDLFTSVR